MRQRLGDALVNIAGRLEPDAPDTDGLSHGGEVRILEARAGIEKSRRFLIRARRRLARFYVRRSRRELVEENRYVDAGGQAGVVGRGIDRCRRVTQSRSTFPSSSGSRATLTAIRRASSGVDHQHRHACFR